MLVCNDSKRKHLVIFSVKEDWEVKEILLPKMTVCYEAAESPDRNFVAISGRKDGIAFIKNGEMLTIYQIEEGKMAEIPIFLSDSSYFIFSSYNPNNNIKKSLHFIKWRS
jgi:hypothetical protein